MSKTSEDGVTGETVPLGIGYMAPIMFPITEFATVKKSLTCQLK